MLHDCHICRSIPDSFIQLLVPGSCTKLGHVASQAVGQRCRCVLHGFPNCLPLFWPRPAQSLCQPVLPPSVHRPLLLLLPAYNVDRPEHMPIQPSFGLSHLAKLPRAGFYLYTGLLPRHDVCMMPASHKTHNAMQEPSKAKLGPSSTVSDSAWSSYVCTQDECSDHISLLAAVHAFQPLLTLDRQAFVTNNKVKDVHSYQAMAATAGMHAAGTPVPGQPDTKPAAGITAAADVVHRVLGTNMPLNQITQVPSEGEKNSSTCSWPGAIVYCPALISMACDSSVACF